MPTHKEKPAEALTRAEMIEILEGIARGGPAHAQIAAIRTLMTLQEGGSPDRDELDELLQM
jgi:hypothetical protein